VGHRVAGRTGMTVSDDPLRLFSEKSELYERFIRFVGYPSGLRAYFTQWPLLRAGMRVLDAGCGTGVVSLALYDAALRRDVNPPAIHAFDLTPAMLQRFHDTLERRGIGGIERVQCDVLRLEALPASWTGYDAIVSASMMEYLPRESLSIALRGLRERLAPGGTLTLFITRRNVCMQPLIGWWWDANLYTAAELRVAFRDAGFAEIALRRFPLLYRYLDVWGHIVEARAST
jgi:cyclopropane fatty-acyl-phospholipid synthase-like methyltransferase